MKGKGKQSTSGASVQSGLSEHSKISKSNEGMEFKMPDAAGKTMQRPSQPKGSAGGGFKFG